jgi:hypothetical protein
LLLSGSFSVTPYIDQTDLQEMQRQGHQLLLIKPVGGELPTAAIQDEALGAAVTRFLSL